MIGSRHRAAPFAAVLVLASALATSAASGGTDQPTVVSSTPVDGAVGVSVETTARVQFSTPVQRDTVTATTFSLVRTETSQVVPAGIIVDQFNDVATLTPAESLMPNTSYAMKLTEGILGANGQPLVPFESSFTTGGPVPPDGPRFSARVLDNRDHNSSLTFGPDGHLYVADAAGEVRRYAIDPGSGLSTGQDVALALPAGHRMLGIAFDPAATATNLLLWATYGQQDAGGFTGRVSRFTVPPRGAGGTAGERVFVQGLPNRDRLSHMTNGLAFGPDGRLYVAQGGRTGMGQASDGGLPETKLSAAILALDLDHSAFAAGQPPLDTSASSYDPAAADAPVRLFSTGLRNTYDLVWHSTGRAYAGTNEAGGAGAMTPSCGGAPSINANVPDSVVQLVSGGYYGHPNPARTECVLKGGNPTSGVDPLEITEYPVGIQPLPAFNPALHRRFDPSACISPNGIAEYTASGALQGWVLIACFIGQGVHALRLDSAGAVAADLPLRDASGEALHFGGALDVAVAPTGRVYIADHGEDGGAPDRRPGAVWVLDPSSSGPPDPPPGPPKISVSDASVGEGNSGSPVLRFTVSLDHASTVEVRVQYQTRNGSAGSRDYRTVKGTLVIPAGATTVTIDVVVKPDTRRERAETVKLKLSRPKNATIADDVGIGTIIDDD